MTMKINFHNETSYDVKGYIKIIKKALKKQKKINNKNTMEIIFTNHEIIKNLNNNYRNINKTTDVLSFVNDSDEKSLGDVFINVDQAIHQAKDYGHNELREIAFLAVHGFLHLLGYDHENEIEEKKMFEKQEEILRIAKIERKA